MVITIEQHKAEMRSMMWHLGLFLTAFALLLGITIGLVVSSHKIQTCLENSKELEVEYETQLEKLTRSLKNARTMP